MLHYEGSADALPSPIEDISWIKTKREGFVSLPLLKLHTDILLILLLLLLLLKLINIAAMNTLSQ